MKINKDLRLLTTTQTELARVMGVTQPYVAQLVKNGTVVSDDEDKNGGVYVCESLKNYYTIVKPSATTDGDDEIDINLERAKRERAERQIAELKLAKMEGNVYDATTVEMVQTEMLANLRTQLLGLPTKLAPMLEDVKKEEAYRLLTDEITEKLMELSEYCPEQYLQEEIEDGYSSHDECMDEEP